MSSCSRSTAATDCKDNLLIHVLHVQEAINIAKETFPELRDVERDRICLEVGVVLPDQQKKTAQISRSAWSALVPSLMRFEIVEIRVTPPTPIAAFSSFKTAAVDLRHASEMSWYSASYLPPFDGLVPAPCPPSPPSPLLRPSLRRHLGPRWRLPGLGLRSLSELLTRVGIPIKSGR